MGGAPWHILVDTLVLVTALGTHWVTSFLRPSRKCSIYLHNYNKTSTTLQSLQLKSIPCVRIVGRKQKVSISETGTNLDSKLGF